MTDVKKITAGSKRLERFTTRITASSALDVERDLRYWRSMRTPSFELRFEPMILRDTRRARNARSFPSRSAHSPPEIIIYARSQDQADVAAMLLYASETIINAHVNPIVGWAPYAAELKTDRSMGSAENVLDNGPKIGAQFSGVVDVAGLAVRLARRKYLTDSAFYFLASVYSFSLPPMDLHPKYGNETIAKQRNPMHRVWEAQSLFAAFQAIDALGLTVTGASKDAPSVKGGKWNQDIRSDLEGRLSKIGVAPSKTILWHRRGPSTSIQRKLQQRTTSAINAQWNWGPIRDQNIAVVDAINHAQWLRSNVAAHSARKRLSQLHPIDVLNVQSLARFLIMSAAGFPWWNERKAYK